MIVEKAVEERLIEALSKVVMHEKALQVLVHDCRGRFERYQGSLKARSQVLRNPRPSFAPEA